MLVDFYADWCGPCQIMAPTLDELAQKRAGEALVLKLDTDANQPTAGRFGIRGIPTVIAFRERQGDGPPRRGRRHEGAGELLGLASSSASVRPTATAVAMATAASATSTPKSGTTNRSQSS